MDDSGSKRRVGPNPLDKLEEVLTGPNLPAIEKGLRLCLYLFESLLRNESLADVADEDWPESVPRFKLDEGGADRLKPVLMGLADDEALPEQVRSFATSVLGASGDVRLKPLLIDRLAAEMRREPRHELVYSLLFALMELGEDPFSRLSIRFFDEAENLADAREFLKRVGRL